MNKLIFLAIFLIISCKNSVEENCFENGKEKQTTYPEFKKTILSDILKANPKHIKIYEGDGKLSYEDEIKKMQEENFNANENIFKEKRKSYEKKFSDFLEIFGEQFLFQHIQKEKDVIYGIAENQFGYWLLEIKNKIGNAYFLGLSDYSYISENQEEKFVKGNQLFLDGSLVRIRESWGLPYGPQMESVKDFIAFGIDLNEVRKDSDNDGFNDLFEKEILTNPNSKDTDNDGISDFNDKNPLYKSEKSKFTDLYQEILDSNYGNHNFSKLNYSFVGYFSDCEYFKKINPKNSKVLIYPESKRTIFKNDYRRSRFGSHLSKIRKSKTDENTFYIYESNDGGTRDYSTEFVDGKWKISSQQTTSI